MLRRREVEEQGQIGEQLPEAHIHFSEYTLHSEVNL